MNDTFWVGVYPGMTEEMVGYMLDTIRNDLSESLSHADAQETTIPGCFEITPRYVYR